MDRTERRALIAERAELARQLEAGSTEIRDPHEDRVEAGESPSSEARRAMGKRGGRNGGRAPRAPAPLRWKPHP